MLPRRHRISQPEDFRRITRRAFVRRFPEGVVFVAPGLESCARFGFVVSKATGNAPVRNRVRRRLRAAAGKLVSTLPSVDVVVRASAQAGNMATGRAEEILNLAIREWETQ